MGSKLREVRHVYHPDGSDSLVYDYSPEPLSDRQFAEVCRQINQRSREIRRLCNTGNPDRCPTCGR